MKKQKGKWAYVQKHRAEIYRVMKKILATEPWEATMSDKKLTDAIRAEGVYSTACMTREVRKDNDVGNSEERKITQFAKQHKK